MTRKLIAVLLAACATLGVRADTWTDFGTGTTWTYTVSSGKASIGGGSITSTAVPNSTTGAIAIPSTLGGCVVTCIDEYAFANCCRLTSIAIPTTITNICKFAFYGCSGLSGVKIPNSVVTIGSSAFSGCSGLTSITLPFLGAQRGRADMFDVEFFGFIFGPPEGNTISEDRVTQMDYDGNRGLYYMPSSLKTVTITDEIKIGSGAFFGCSGLTSVTMPNGVTSIGEYAFYGCAGLASVTIPNSVTSIGGKAFSGCSGLVNVTIPSSVASIGYQAFYGCSGMESFVVGDENPSYKSVSGLLLSKDGKTLICGVNGDVTIPNSVTGIESSAFYGCSGLTSVTIPNCVTSIGDYAFSGCSGLTSVTIPDSVTSLGYHAFSGCSGLRSVTIGSSVTSIGSSAFAGCSGLKSVTIPNSVTSIGDYAFSGCSGMKSFVVGDENPSYKSVSGLLLSKDGKTLISGVNGDVTIPDGVAAIGHYAFSGRSGLASVTIPGSVTSIGDFAFSGCSGLTSVTIPSSVTSIGDCAFYDCSRLASVAIPDSVTSISDSAFSGCSGMEAFVVGDENPSYKSVSGLLLSKDGKTLICGVNGDVTIPDGVTAIGHYVFSGCSGLTSITIPNSVTNIGWAAFSGCSGLTSVTIPNSVTSIGNSAFSGCSELSHVTIGSNVKVIEVAAFEKCALRSVVFLGNKPENVSDDIYSAATSLTTFVPQGASGWDDALAVGSWNGHPIAMYVDNPDGTVTLVEYSGRDVEEICVPDMLGGKKVSSISQRAFASCAGLKTVTVPATVTFLADEAFAGCSSLMAVKYLGDAPDVGNGIYRGTPRALVSYVIGGSIGWSGGISSIVPDTWNDRAIVCTWTVTFDACGGVVEGSGTMAVTNLSPIGSLPLAARGEYTFEGWFTASSGGVQVDVLTRVVSNITYYAHWKKNESGGSGGGGLDPIPTTYIVTFDLNGAGGATPAKREVSQGAAVGTLPTPTRNGYSFLGWFTAASGGSQVYATSKVTANVTYYAHWQANGGSGAGGGVDPTPTTYTVTFDLNGAGGTTPSRREVAQGAAVGTLPTPTRNGYAFLGWFTAASGGSKVSSATIITAYVTYYAHWEKNADPVPPPEPESEQGLYDDVEEPVPATAASEYNGYLVDAKGSVKGTIQVKVGKPGKDGRAAVKATVQIVGAKKVNLKAAEKGKAPIAKDGPTEVVLVGGDNCRVLLGSDGLSGSYGAYTIDGARNFFTSKDKAEASAADALLAKLPSAVNVVWDGGNASAAIAKKGKVKVSGALSDGKTKISASAALLIGEEWCCIPVSAPKAGLSFTIWLSRDGKKAAVEGLGNGAVVGAAGTVPKGAAFRIDGAAFAAMWGLAPLPYLPDGVSVAQNGTKWVVAGGAKAGKIAIKNGVLDDSKAGANPSGLKLTYKAKGGSFSGSFKAYAVVGGKLKTVTVNVSGVMVGNVGYGTATIKKVGAVPVRIK